MALYRLPILTLLLGLLALAMLIPSAFAAFGKEWKIARAFLHPAIFTMLAACVVSFLVPANREVTARRELRVLLLAWLLVPAFAAIPVVRLEPTLGAVGGWVEMVLAFTTTGGSLFADLTTVPDAVHLWRGIVGWFGGLVTLIAAYVIMAPRRLGGFEVDAGSPRSAGTVNPNQSVVLTAATPPLEARLARAIRIVLPVYAGLTALLALILSGLGESGLNSSVHAMSIMATSGISPDPEGIAGASSFLAELVIAAFLVLAASRVLYFNASQIGRAREWRTDPELKLMGWLVALATFLLFARHWVGAITVDEQKGSLDALAALWGTIFTTLSFLTTTGFESAFWETARDWSGLQNPGLLLLGLCAVGGGAATTAGGVKLIRAYALIRHGMREVQRIAQPDSVIGIGLSGRTITRQGAVIAWTFIMLYFIALMIVIVGLAASGMRFENALVAATAAISNTGPIFPILSSDTSAFADLSRNAQVILGLAAIAGRIEVLALVAIFNVDAWRQSFDATKNHW
ncbi:MAG: potassium transporter TrkG [Pseudomonadota bacterium]